MSTRTAGRPVARQPLPLREARRIGAVAGAAALTPGAAVGAGAAAAAGPVAGAVAGALTAGTTLWATFATLRLLVTCPDD